MRTGAARHELVTDALSAAFPPVVLFLLTMSDVVRGNVRELLYHPPLVYAFLLASAITWAIGCLILRRYRGRIPARLWLALPLAVLMLDSGGALIERWDPPFAIAAAADVLIAAGVLALARALPWAVIHQGAALAGLVLCAQVTVVHAMFVRDLSPHLIAGANRGGGAVPNAGSDRKGNVYHILLDNYLSESFAYSAGADAARRYPGFTFYTRFNTNFPRTSSSEMALIEGRLPRPGMSIREWPERALRRGFWADLVASNVGLWIYPYGRYLCPQGAVKCAASSDMEPDAPAAATRAATIDLWALRLLPVSLRDRLSASQSWFSVTSAFGSVFGAARHAAPGVTTVSALPTQYFNLKQFDELLADEIRRPAHGQYVYYHAMIPHPDFIFDEQCNVVKVTGEPASYLAFVRCANLMLERLVQTLDRLGRLDEALVIVHADHGDPGFLLFPGYIDRRRDFAIDAGARAYQAVDTTYADDGRAYESLYEGDSAAWRSIAVEVLSSGLLLTKFPGAGVYSEDTRPVQLLDIAPTVLAHFGRETRSYDGTPIPLVDPGRQHVFYAHSRDYDGKLSKYLLTAAGWQFAEDIPVAP